MKNLNIFLKTFFFLAALSATAVVFNSCEKDDNDGGNGGTSVKLLESISYDGELSHKFEYDNENRITKVLVYYDFTDIPGIYTFIYDDNSVSMSFEYPPIFANDDFWETYTKNGNIITVTKSFFSANTIATIELDAEEKPVKYIVDSDSYMQTYTYEYTNGNLVKQDFEEVRKDMSIPAFPAFTTFTYDNKKSPFYYCKTPSWCLDSFLSWAFRSEISIKNNVKSITWNDNIRRIFTLSYDGDFLKSWNDGIYTRIFTYITK